MKKIILSFLCGCTFFIAFSQSANNTDSITLNVLSAPASPAFNLLGISPSAIQSPTDLTAFRLSVQNATNNFTSFPSNYAADLSPASIFNIKNQTLDKFNSTKFRDVFWQSFDVSFAIAKMDSNGVEKNDSTAFTKFGFGLKFSFIRPRWIDSTQKYIDSIYYYQHLSNLQRRELFRNNPLIDSIEKLITNTDDRAEAQRLIALIPHIEDSLLLSRSEDIVASNLKRLASGLTIKRKGLFLDFATGMVIDFPGERFNNGTFSRAGAWLTGGFENTSNNGLSVLAIARYLYQPDKIFADDNGKIKAADISTFDAGAKLDFRGSNARLSLNIETIYRSVLNKNTIDPSWRTVFNASYNVGMNKLLTFSFGKNFDGSITKDGNLVAALNFIMGFGSSKKIGK